MEVEISHNLPAGGDSQKSGSAERFQTLFFENPPFILERRRILLQGSLSIWMDEVVQKLR